MLAQKIARNLAKIFQREQFAEMAIEESRDQVIVRISMENGIPRIRQLTGKERKQFTKTHPKSQLSTFSLEEISRITDRTMSVVNDPTAS